jgi:hypothetical protein
MQESGNHVIICGNVIAADCDGERVQVANDNIKMRTSFDTIYHIGNRDTFGIGFSKIKNIKEFYAENEKLQPLVAEK